ncbi:hypothetical protein B0H15DRAFT_840663 [Mycena belliarum]|uniref:F-box domain-containing protein n=1 Tax=Mycena belliarum TaxID=1033014 RepID=A0AAD6XP41_9AGAR|nr:hypothetical protein B0H15DRAFT_840663 [Mycena belliae]
MHRCLSLPEVFQIILEKLDEAHSDLLPPLYRSRGSSSHARLARTCRLFSDAALNMLWRNQCTMIALLKCFPAHLWEVTGLDSSPTTGVFRFLPESAIGPADWERFLLYAARIKTITLGLNLYAHAADLPLDALEMINITRPAECILPNLRKLHWVTTDPTVFPFIRLFLCPGISAISLVLEPTPAHRSLLLWLGSTAHSLQEVSLSGTEVASDNEADPATLNAITSFILTLDKIKTLSVPRLHPSAQRHLASLPSLSTLRIENFVSIEPGSSHAHPYPHPSFPALSHLTLGATKLASATKFLTKMSPSALKTLVFYDGPVSTSVVMGAFFAALHSSGAHLHLTQLTICFTTLPLDFVDPAAYRLTTAVLTPLLSFSSLQSVEMLARTGFEIDDPFCAVMAAAWPQLERLDLNTDFGYDMAPPPAATAASLLAFATHCPRLTELTLPLDMTLVPELPPRSLRPQQTALQVLGVLDSAVDSKTRTARFLASLFPRLTRIYSAIDGSETGVVRDRDWAAVQELVSDFAAVILDEDRHWRAESMRLRDMVDKGTQV